MISFFQNIFRNKLGGVVDTMRNVLRTVSSILFNRVELLFVELEEEKDRSLSAAIWSGAFLFCAFIAIALISVTILFLFWEQRLLVFLILFLIFAFGWVLSFYLVKTRYRSRGPFEESAAQLRKDREWLKKKN
ncbi:MAG: phage holin family protein [Verrucomicrobiota bacterium]